jgi:hypothetical protein
MGYLVKSSDARKPDSPHLLTRLKRIELFYFYYRFDFLPILTPSMFQRGALIDLQELADH